MSIFWGVYLPPPQKYTSLERVVTTATGVSLTVLSLGHKQRDFRGIQRKMFYARARGVTYLGFFIAEFSRATRSSSSLTQRSRESSGSTRRNAFSPHIFSSQLTVGNRRRTAGPEPAQLLVYLQDPVAKRPQLTPDLSQKSAVRSIKK